MPCLWPGMQIGTAKWWKSCENHCAKQFGSFPHVKVCWIIKITSGEIQYRSWSWWHSKCNRKGANATKIHRSKLILKLKKLHGTFLLKSNGLSLKNLSSRVLPFFNILLNKNFFNWQEYNIIISKSATKMDLDIHCDLHPRFRNSLDSLGTGLG